MEVLRRWQSFLSERAKENDPVLAPWFALAALPAEGFAEKARELIERWNATSGRVANQNAEGSDDRSSACDRIFSIGASRTGISDRPIPPWPSMFD